MAGRAAHDVEHQVHRTGADPPGGAAAPERERRYVFGGDPQSSVAGYAIRPNKRGLRRKRSTFNIIVALFGSAVAIVLYIGNIIAVNQLALDVDQLQAQYDKIVNANEALRAEINRKSGPERIGRIAAEELHLRSPSEQPAWFDIDTDKLEELQSE
jgi:cell division protein FtsL